MARVLLLKLCQAQVIYQALTGKEAAMTPLADPSRNSWLLTPKRVSSWSPPSNEKELAKQAMAEGDFEYITKPINPNYLAIAFMTKIAILGGVNSTDVGDPPGWGRGWSTERAPSPIQNLQKPRDLHCWRML